MERKLSVNFRGFRIIVVEALEDMRRDYISRIMARDHNYLFNLNFCEIALYDKLFSSFRGPIVAGLDTWNQDRQPPLNQDVKVTRSAQASMALAPRRGLLFFRREVGSAEGSQPEGDR
jgi:hypothetical protein